MKKLLVALLLVTGCSTKPSPFDSVSYRVYGKDITGSVIIDYSTPTDGVITTISTLAAPFNPGPIAGFNQFINTVPTLTVTIVGTGCVAAQILVNALVVNSDNRCGPVTFSIQYNGKR